LLIPWKEVKDLCETQLYFRDAVELQPLTMYREVLEQAYQYFTLYSL